MTERRRLQLLNCVKTKEAKEDVQRRIDQMKSWFHVAELALHLDYTGYHNSGASVLVYKNGLIAHVVVCLFVSGALGGRLGVHKWAKCKNDSFRGRSVYERRLEYIKFNDFTVVIMKGSVFHASAAAEISGLY